MKGRRPVPPGALIGFTTSSRKVGNYLCRGPGGGVWGGGNHYISMGKDVLTKGVLFSESVWNGGICHCQKSGKGFKYTCLERGSCLSGKGVVNYLSLEFYFR